MMDSGLSVLPKWCSLFLNHAICRENCSLTSFDVSSQSQLSFQVEMTAMNLGSYSVFYPQKNADWGGGQIIMHSCWTSTTSPWYSIETRHRKGKGKGVGFKCRSLADPHDFTIITPLIIGNGRTLTRWAIDNCSE